MESDRLKSYYKFEKICIEVIISWLKKFQFTDFQHSDKTKDQRFDLIAKGGKDGPVVIEIKYFRSKSAPYSMLARAADYLVTAIQDSDLQLTQPFYAALVVSSYATDEEQNRLFTEKGVLLIDRRRLLWFADLHPELKEQLNDIFLSDELGVTESADEAVKPEKYSEGKTFADYFKTSNKLVSQKAKLKVVSNGDLLCKEIKLIKKGKSGWKEFEKKGEDAIKYIFKDFVTNWRVQNESINGLHRVDLVGKLLNKHDFIDFIYKDFNTRYALFEFKNYTDKISQDQIYTTERYLYEMAFRKLAIIVTRVGADNSALKACEGALIESRKLIITLDENDLCKMLHMKDRGDDTIGYISGKVDDFLMMVSR